MRAQPPAPEPAAPAASSLVTFGLGPGAFRFALAVAVLVFHMTRWFTLGHTAVFAFFVLSGFWMSRMYEEKYAHLPLATYAASRALRLFPLILLSTAFTIGLWLVCGLPVPLEPLVLFRNATVLGLSEYESRIVTPAWSLDYELQFYLVLPFLIALRRKLGDAGLWAMFALSVAAVAARTFADVRSFVLEYLAFFLAGMLLHRPDGGHVFSRRVVLGSLGAFALLFFLPFAFPGSLVFQALFFDVNKLTELYGLRIWETYNATLALLLVPLIDHNVRSRSTGRDRTLGDTSFALYLVHWAPLIVYMQLTAKSPLLIKALAAAALFFGSIALGLAAQRFIDAPLEAFRRRWLQKREAEVTAALAATDR